MLHAVDRRQREAKGSDIVQGVTGWDVLEGLTVHSDGKTGNVSAAAVVIKSNIKDNMLTRSSVAARLAPAVVAAVEQSFCFFARGLVHVLILGVATTISTATAMAVAIMEVKTDPVHTTGSVASWRCKMGLWTKRMVR